MEQLLQFIIVFFLFLILTIIYIRSNKVEQPEAEKREGQFVWNIKKEDKILMVELNHDLLNWGIVAHITEGVFDLYNTGTGQRIEDIIYRAASFPFSILKEEMKRYLEGKLPEQKDEIKPIRSLRDHKIEYTAVMKGDEMEHTIGGKRNVFQQVIDALKV